MRLAATFALALALGACASVHVSDPSATVAYTSRGDDDGVRAGVGYQYERMTGVVGAGATTHVGFDSVFPDCELEGKIGCDERARFVPRFFYLFENDFLGKGDRHVVGVEIAAGGWW